jgi:PST family polysaccharide transporter
VSIPAAIGLAFVAKPFVLAVIGTKWAFAVVPLEILSLNAIARTFPGTAYEVFQARGRPQYRVVASAAYLILVVPALIIGSRLLGLDGAAWALVAVNAVVGVPIMIAMMRLMEADAAMLLRVLARPALIWIVMIVVLLLLKPGVEGQSAAAQLAILVAGGTAAYAVAAALFAREIVSTMWRSLRGRSLERVGLVEDV